MRLLIIEDGQHHQHYRDSAEKFFAEHGVEVTFLKNLKSFLEMFEGSWDSESRSVVVPSFRYDGVLSDIFFPHDEKYFPELVPAGVAVFFICQSKGIPCLLVTAGFHHRQEYQWIHEITMTMKLPKMISVYDETTKYGKVDAPEKEWESAFQSMVNIIEKRK